MLRTLLVSLCFLGLVSEASAHFFAKPLLWEAKKGEQTVHVFGTFHLGIGLSDFPPSLQDYVKRSSTFLMETELSASTARLMQERALLPAGQSLDQYLPAETWEKLIQMMAGILPEESLKQLKPWYVSIVMTQMAIQQLRFEGSLDLELREFARAQSLELGHLESADIQISVMEASFPSHVLDASLRQTENPLQTMKQGLVALHGCFVLADLACLEKNMGPSSKGGTLEPFQIDLLLKQRNRTWIPKIEKASRHGKTFVAVGAGHLVGEDNVLELLAEEGFTIRRIEF